MRDDGVKDALAFVTSAYSSFSSCRQYRENIAAAQVEVGENAPQIEKLRAFYKSVFPNAKVETVSDFMAVFELEGQRFNALNGGPQYRFNEAVSFFISVETQEEVDYFWSRLTADGGEESRCGWLKDRFGLSWQVIPTKLGRYLGDSDRTKANRVMQAMMGMKKIVIAELDKAYAG